MVGGEKMTNIIEALKALILRMTKVPSNIPFIINESIGTSGKAFDLVKELSGFTPCYIQIKSDKNFTLMFSMKRTSPDNTWPDTLSGGMIHKWIDEGWTNIKITPVATANVTGYASAVDPRGKRK